MNVQCQARPRFINHPSRTYPTRTLYLQRVTKNFVSLLLKCTFGARYFAHNSSAQSVTHNHSHSCLFHTWLLAGSISHSESLHSTSHPDSHTRSFSHLFSNFSHLNLFLGVLCERETTPDCFCAKKHSHMRQWQEVPFQLRRRENGDLPTKICQDKKKVFYKEGHDVNFFPDCRLDMVK